MVCRSMFLPALVAVVGLLSAGGAVPAEAASQPAAPRYDPALEVTIDSMTPSYIPERGPIRVTGSVTNADDVPWAAINLYPFLGSTPMTTTEELVVAADADPLLDVGKRITETEVTYKIDALEPDETATFSLTIPRDLLTTSGPGVYWFGVHALGESIESPREPGEAVADGRSRTFLPYVPAGTPGFVETALVLPIRHYLPYEADGSLQELQHWRRTLSPDGRMRGLVDFADSSGTTPLTWLVDPAVPDAIRRIAAGNPPRSLAPTDDGTGEEPEESPSGEPSPTADPGGPPPDDRELTEEEQAAADAATDWLSRFESAVQGDEVLKLPYGDLDVAAAAELAPDLYEAARERPSQVLGDWGVTTTSAVVAPSGYLNEAGLELVPDDGTTVMVTDRMFGEDPPGVANVGGTTVGVMSSGAADGGPRPGDRFGTLQLRQRILSEAALRLLGTGRHPLVVPLPVKWRPGAASAFFAGLDVEWLDLTTVADAIDRDGNEVDPDELAYPPAQQRRQLDAPAFQAVDGLISAGETLQNLLSLNTEVASTVTDQALAGASYGSRQIPLVARNSLEQSRDWITTRFESVRISAGPGVTLSGTDGGFATVISNDLDHPVTVNVVATSNGGVDISPVDPVQLAANSRATVVLDAHANRVGVTNVTLHLTDVDGTVIGPSDTVPIRSAQVSVVIWLIIGTGLGLLFFAILVRLVRRVRGRPREPAAPLESTT